MSLYNLRTLSVHIKNAHAETHPLGLYVLSYLPKAGAVSPGVLYLILTFVCFIIVFVAALLIILRSSALTSPKNEQTRQESFPTSPLVHAQQKRYDDANGHKDDQDAARFQTEVARAHQVSQ